MARQDHDESTARASELEVELRRLRAGNDALCDPLERHGAVVSGERAYLCAGDAERGLESLSRFLDSSEQT